MTAAELLTQVRDAGIRLDLRSGQISVKGSTALLATWAPLLRQHRADLVQVLQDLQDSANDATETVIARASRLWLIHHADGRMISHSFTPAATETEVRGWYPEALSIEVEDDCDE